MSNKLDREFRAGELLRFAFPSIATMMLISMYTIVDGMFAARYVGSNALSAINIVFPIPTLQFAVGLMLAAGGSAVIARKMGEGESKQANEIYTMVMTAAVLGALAITAFAICNLEPLCRKLGANDLLLPDCKTYLTILVLFAPAAMLQVLYQSCLVTAGMPQVALVLTVLAGAANMLLDYVFMGLLNWGVAGAAAATGIGQTIPAVVGSAIFLFRKQGLRFVPFRMHWRALGEACVNGSSEMVSQLACAVVTVMYNLILMKMEGSDGVAAITIILYSQFLFGSFFSGFVVGVAPIFGFHLGAGNREQLARLFKICTLFIVISSGIVTTAALWGSAPVSAMFVPVSSNTYLLAARGMKLFAVGFIFNGLNIAASGMLTALSDGLHSAIISFARTFVLLVAALLLLPQVLGVDGVWLAVPAAEAATALLSVAYLFRYIWKRHCQPV